MPKTHKEKSLINKQDFFLSISKKTLLTFGEKGWHYSHLFYNFTILYLLSLKV
jgi:hypothetical protein